MITLKELFDNDCENIISDIESYRPNEYYPYPFPTLEEYIEEFMQCTTDPWDEISDYGWEDEEAYKQKCIEDITKAYKHIKNVRDNFREAQGRPKDEED